jgi:hypothetical protein
MMKSFLILTLLFITLTANAQSKDAMPEMLLGRGLLSSQTIRHEIKISRKEYNEIALRNGDTPTKAGYQKFIAYLHQGASEELPYLAFECVGRSSRNELNCFKVQPVLIDLQKQTVIQRGHILFVSDLELNTGEMQPTPKQVKQFLSALRQAYQRDFPVGLNALSDREGWNWSTEPSQVSGGIHSRLTRFLMGYDPVVALNQIEAQKLFDENNEQTYEAAEKKLLSDKKIRLIQSPYPQF